MKVKYFLSLLIIGFASACLESEYSIEIEESTEISFDDCPFFGFWADTLWCADTLLFYTPTPESILDTQLVITGIQYMDVHDWPNYRRFTFTFIIHNFQGTGKYTYPNAESEQYYNDDFEFTIVDLDVISTLFNVADVAKGGYGELSITQFDANTGFIKGTANGLLTDAVGNAPNSQHKLQGVNFQGFIQ